MEPDIHGTQLYEAATNSLAADASSENCWTIMANNCYGHEISVILPQLKAVEKQIKEEYKLTSMPNAWRSAKSVVLGAMAKGISLKDDNDNVRGKTEIQQQLKESKESKIVRTRGYIGLVTELRILCKDITLLSKIQKALVGNIPGLKLDVD